MCILKMSSSLKRKAEVPAHEMDEHELRIDQALDVICGYYQMKVDEFRAFSDEVMHIAYSHNQGPLDYSSMERSLTSVVTFLREQLDSHDGPRGGFNLQHFARRAWLHAVFGNYDPTHAQKLKLNESRHAADQAISLCMLIMREMFGLEDVETCVTIARVDHQPLAVSKLRFAMLQHRVEDYEDEADMFVKHLYDLIVNLDIKYNLHYHKEQQIATAISFFSESKYPGLKGQLWEFVNELRTRFSTTDVSRHALTFEDLGTLLTKIVGPYLESYEAPSLLARIAFSVIASRCMRHGKFAVFGPFLLEVAQLSVNHERELRHFFDLLYSL